MPAKRKNRLFKPLSRRQERRRREIFFINTASAYQKAIQAEADKWDGKSDITEQANKVEAIFKTAVHRFAALQYVARRFSGPKSHVRRQFKFALRRLSPRQGQVRHTDD